MCAITEDAPDFEVRCSDMPGLIVDYCLDPGELSGLKKHYIREHLGKCPTCGAKLQALQAAVGNDLNRIQKRPFQARASK